MSAADIFAGVKSCQTVYRCELQFVNDIVGGIPSDRDVTEKWLRSRMDLTEAALAELVDQTVADRGVLTPDEAVQAVLSSPLAPSINGFKRDDNGELCIEGRIVKAALKEYANSSYPGTVWPGKNKLFPGKKDGTSALQKGLKAYLAEAVHVPEVMIGLGVKEPTRVEERIKHVRIQGRGTMGVINRVEVVHRPSVVFHVEVRDDFLPVEAWKRMWENGERIGLGSDRARSDGKFEVVGWEKVS